MRDRSTNVLLYCGGKMTIGKQGPTYDKPHQKAIRLKRGTTYTQLLEKIYSVMCINSTSSIIKLTFRCPQHLGQNTVTYVAIEIVDDETVELMLEFPFDHPSVTLVELYLEIEDLVSGFGNSTLTILSQDSPIVGDSHHVLHSQGCPSENCTDPMFDSLFYTEEPNPYATEKGNENEEGDKSNTMNESISGISKVQPSSNGDLFKGLNFETKAELQLAVKNTSIENNTEYAVLESTTKKWAVRCLLHDKCKWRLRACLRKKNGRFEITQYSGPHTCKEGQAKTTHKLLDAELISRRIKSLVEVDPSMKIAAVIDRVHDEFGYKISYYKAWSAKKKAMISIFGTHKRSQDGIQSQPSA